MARPTKEVRKLAAVDKLYEACKIAEMRIQKVMSERPAKSKEKKVDQVVLKVLADALAIYEGPET
jgi:hypothetical protein